MNIYDYAETKKLPLNRVLDFTSAANPLGPSGKAKHAARKAVRSLDLFPDDEARLLKRLISRLEKVDEDMVVVGGGSTGILDSLLRLVKPRVVAVLSPLSASRRRLLEDHGIIIKTVPLDESRGYALDCEKLVRETGDAHMLIVPNPHDICGSLVSGADMAALVDETAKRGQTLLIDEAYFGFADVASSVRGLIDVGQTLVLRSFSVFHGLAGLRLGYAMGSKSIVERVAPFMSPSGVNAIAIAAGLASLRDQSFIRRTRRFIAGEKEYLIGAMKKIDKVECLDTPCNFLVLRFGEEGPEIAGRLRQKRILVDEYADALGRSIIRLPVKSRKLNAFFVRSLRAALKG